MTAVGPRTVRRVLAVTAVAIGSAVVVLQDACVIASPSGDLPRLPDSRPTIVHSSLVPTTSAVLTHFPSTFSVPVELSDPTVDFVYAAFIDYNPLTGEGLVDVPRDSLFTAANAEPGRTGLIRTIKVNIPAPSDLGACHRIEIIVALRLNRRDPKNAHTPEEPPGGDIATWFYNPNGDLGGCPSLDAGIDAELDAAEAGEGGRL
jgi:hypothetical protein